MPHEHDTIGRPHWRVDALGKVTGSARFGADLRAPGMLFGAVLRARRPHARILTIDTGAALALPGVRAVLTGADLPAARTFGGIVRDIPVLAWDRVRHWGDGVAAVAADTPEQAATAAAAIRVEYEDLPPIFDPEAALAPDAPLVHEPGGGHSAGAAAHDGRGEHGADAGDGGPSDDDRDPRANLCARHHVRQGDANAALAAAELVLERTYRTQAIEHAYLEPEAVLAEVTPDGGIRIIGSIQNIFTTRRALGEILQLDLARVTVEHATMGGSFGGKDEVMSQMACRAALLAQMTGRPVKLVNTREESLAESYKRHPYVLHYRVGASRDGRLTAVHARIVADAGAYTATSPFVTWRSAVQATGPYACENVDVEVVAAFTNNVYTGAMRGFGSPQVNFAIESLMDELAAALDLDPLELRRRNIFREGAVTATGQALPPGVSLAQVLELAEERSGWAERRSALAAANAERSRSGDARRRGLGLACSYRGVSLGAEGVDAAGAIVSVQTDGSVLVSIGLTDMGQGVATTMSLIAAEVLGIDVTRVKFFDVHTGRVPDSGPTVASRSTVMGGQAVRKAAVQVRQILDEVAAEMLRAPANEVRCRGGRFFRTAGGERPAAAGGADTVPFAEVAARAFALGRPLLGFGWHKGEPTTWNEKTGRGDAYFTFVYGANVAEVEVDTATGKVDVLRVVAVHDVGRAISPAMVRSQVYGGVVMGMGYGVLEQYLQHEGVPATHNFDEYLLPTAMDLPDIDVVIVENPDPAGPFGAKSVGEPATEIAAPAIANAVAHATGQRVRSLPADLESVLLGAPLARPTRRAAALAAAPKSGGKPCAG
ncbi:MAG: xanthine dehydrogenase family protein molybdopterin-binding subunit [Candidatus Krumholzibacteriia bacterium]